MAFLHFKLFSQVKNTLHPIAGFDQAQLDTIAKYLADFPNNTQLSIAIIKGGKVQYLGVTRQADILQTIENQQAQTGRTVIYVFLV